MADMVEAIFMRYFRGSVHRVPGNTFLEILWSDGVSEESDVHLQVETHRHDAPFRFTVCQVLHF